jgi:hypothetical protein
MDAHLLSNQMWNEDGTIAPGDPTLATCRPLLTEVFALPDGFLERAGWKAPEMAQYGGAYGRFHGLKEPEWAGQN